MQIILILRVCAVVYLIIGIIGGLIYLFDEMVPLGIAIILVSTITGLLILTITYMATIMIVMEENIIDLRNEFQNNHQKEQVNVKDSNIDEQKQEQKIDEEDISNQGQDKVKADRITYSTGTEYVGECKNGKPDGKGTFYTLKGLKYVGEFKDGMFHGQGTMTHPNGSIQSGKWESGKYVGK